jgi:hypothetical protein
MWLLDVSISGSADTRTPVPGIFERLVEFTASLAALKLEILNH